MTPAPRRDLMAEVEKMLPQLLASAPDWRADMQEHYRSVSVLTADETIARQCRELRMWKTQFADTAKLADRLQAERDVLAQDNAELGAACADLSARLTQAQGDLERERSHVEVLALAGLVLLIALIASVATHGRFGL